MIPSSLRVLVASLGSSASTVRRSSVKSAPMPVSLSIALTGRSRKRLEALAASAISLRPNAVSWSTFLPNSGLLLSSAANSVTNFATLSSSSLVSLSFKGTRPAASFTVTEAAGLEPLKDNETSELDDKVAKFVTELAALDSNSPEFGKKVDQLTALGRKEIAEAANASNRFLDRPVKAIDSDTGIGADLTELRRTVEDLDPKEANSGMTTRKFLGIIPFGKSINHY